MISKLVRLIDVVESRYLRNLSYVLLGLGLMVAINEVIFRYLFRHSFAFSNELVTLAIVNATLLNYGLAQKSGKHIRVGLFSSYLPPPWQTGLALLSNMAGVGLCSILIYHTHYLSLEVMKYKFTTEVLRIPTCISYFVFELAFLLLAFRYGLEFHSDLKKFRGMQCRQS